MGSRIMHLAIAGEIIKRYHVKNPPRFLYGSILPDAAIEGNSHWRTACCDGRRQTFDLAGFRERYESELNTDDLIRGYYLHLVQDMIMREYLQEHTAWKAGRRNAGRIHHDYRCLNRVLTEQYKIRDLVQTMQTQDTGELFDANVRFNGEILLDSIRQDMDMRKCSKGRFLTKERAAEYIDQSVEYCTAELQALDEGRSSLPDAFISWEWVKPALWIRVRRKLYRVMRGGIRKICRI